jgi:two-component system LytT family response regulator
MSAAPLLRAVLVDDEPPARALLREYLRAHTDLEIVGECGNGFEAVKVIGESAPDLVFLDVQMPKLDGFEVLELLDPGPLVVFVTAFDEYALRAFEVNAVDYLLKPVSRERLAASLEKARQRRERGKPETDLAAAQKLAADARPPGVLLSRILVKEGTQVFAPLARPTSRRSRSGRLPRRSTPSASCACIAPGW